MSGAENRFEIVILHDWEKLALEWQALESRSDGGFFLSWTWIATWLESLDVAPVLVRAKAGDEIIALGLLVCRKVWRHGFMRSRQIILHEAGDEDLDRLAVEYNGFLTSRVAAPGLVADILEYLGNTPNFPWDECVMPGIRAREMASIHKSGFAIDLYRQSLCFAVDLSELRGTGITLLDRISRNARAQLRRALRLAEADGPLTLVPAQELDQALLYFDALTKLDRWTIGLRKGAFATRARVVFHRRLIARALPRGEVEILQFRAGEKVLGYLYQFLYRGRVLSYQIGYQASGDNRRHLGLVMHYLAVERAKTRGQDIYDFMAGDARYKRSLGSVTDMLAWARIQKPRWPFYLERKLRGIARRIRG